jgi:hypothetical protein
VQKLIQEYKTYEAQERRGGGNRVATLLHVSLFASTLFMTALSTVTPEDYPKHDQHHNAAPLPVCTRFEHAPGPAPEDQALTTYVSMDECKRMIMLYESIRAEIAQP